MNKLLVGIAWFVVASGSYAQDSVFDGIYNILVDEQPAYATVQIKGSEAVVLLLSDGSWEPFLGTLESEVLTVKGVADLVGVDIQLSAQFTSPSVINIVVDYCERLNFLNVPFQPVQPCRRSKFFNPWIPHGSEPVLAPQDQPAPRGFA